MKRIIVSLIALFTAALTTQATLILSNSFPYSDGALVTVSTGSPLGVWTTHSGTSAQIQVAGGTVNIAGPPASEDISTVLTNASFPQPFINGNTLYASFTMNFYRHPSGSYFAHFRDTGTTLFTARVFATTNGASTDKYRIGIANAGNSPVYVATDLSTNTEYKIVIRYPVTGNATLWINPNSESSLVNRADANDTTSTAAVYNFCLRQGVTGTGDMGALYFDNLLIGNDFTNVATVGGAPTITGIADQSIAANANTGPLAFLVDDVETAPGSLTLSGTSTNTTLVPNNPANISFGGSGNNRTVTITPAANQQGVTLISVVVTDGNNLTATNSFLVIVGAPSISAIPNQTTLTNTPTSAIPFTVNDAETPGSLTITKSSSNQALVQDANIVINNLGGANRTVTITPEANQGGQTTITLTVSDGLQSASTSFVLTVYPHLPVLLGDDFSYSDGFLPSVSSAFWVAHSAGDSNDCLVVSGKVRLTRTNSTDCSAFFSNSVSVAATSGAILYSKFTVNFLSLPTANGGGYFAHFRDTGTLNFRGRVFAETNGAASGLFRIGIANGGFTVADVPRDLSLNTTYVVVTRYNVGSASSTVWVNPISEPSASATAIDPTSAVDIWNYAFRQDGTSGNIGVLHVDDLKVGTAFADVFTPPGPAPLNSQVIGGNLVLSWTNSLLALESATAVSGPYSTIAGATSPYTNAIAGAEKYFRLKY